MTNSDLPVVHNALYKSTANIDVAEETVPMCEHDNEASISNTTLEDKTTRLVFIQKVLTIRLLQLLGVVMIMTTFVVDSFDIRFYMAREKIERMIIVSSVIAVIIFGLMVLVCFNKLRLTKLFGCIFLVAYPLSYTLAICFAMIWWDILEISAAWWYYWTAVVALLGYSTLVCQTKLEFVTTNAILISFLVLIVMFALSVPFIYDPNVLYILLATSVVAVDLIFLLFNLELMTSKNYRIIITPDDFVDGAINLHIDYYYTFVNAIVPRLKNGFKKLTACKKNESN